MSLYNCKYCGKGFKREHTLSVHQCVKKRRHLDRDLPPSRIAFRMYQRFYQLLSSAKGLKTVEEFIESQYYIDFVKFGHYFVELNPIYPESFIDYLLKNGVKIKDWAKEKTYAQYIEDMLKREPATTAVERSIHTMSEWAEQNNIPMSDFFKHITPNEAAHIIRRGRLSPWVLYLAESADTLMQSFTEDHANMVGPLIDPVYWKSKFKNNADDVEFMIGLFNMSSL